MSFPKFAFGSAAPGGPVWVVRLRNPFIIARCQTVGLAGIHLHGWPPEAPHETTESKLAKSMQQLGVLWAEATDDQMVDSVGWDFSLADSPPPFLFIENPDSKWEAVLQPERRLLWTVSDEGDVPSLRWVPKFGTDADDEDMRAVTDFYRDFLHTEKTLHDEEGL